MEITDMGFFFFLEIILRCIGVNGNEESKLFRITGWNFLSKIMTALQCQDLGIYITHGSWAGREEYNCEELHLPVE